VKPFRERNPVVVSAVGLAVLAGVLLAAFRLDDILALTGRTYQAAFRDASGLATGNEVRIAGVRVGQVTDVGLGRHGSTPYVRVRFRLDDRGLRLGRDTGATIRIKTVLGQKYLALTPAGPDRLAGDAEIPLERTASPFDVMQAVTGLAGTLDQIDSKQLAAAFNTLAQTFADTPGNVRSSLGGLSRLSAKVCAERDEEFRKLVADGDALLTEVSRRRDAIHDLLVGTDRLATQLSGLVTDNRAQLEPTLRQLRGVVAILQRNRDNLEKTLQRMGPFVEAFANVIGNGRWFDTYLRGLLQPYLPATTGGR
jgi:phospholipid/cholesterol/gamma-HCH transport system substrate-binding protein